MISHFDLHHLSFNQENILPVLEGRVIAERVNHFKRKKKERKPHKVRVVENIKVQKCRGKGEAKKKKNMYPKS